MDEFFSGNDDIFSNNERTFDDVDLDQEHYDCYSCSWTGTEPYVVEAYSEMYYMCPNCGADLGY